MMKYVDLAVVVTMVVHGVGEMFFSWHLDRWTTLCFGVYLFFVWASRFFFDGVPKYD